jgi:hypothetical protein
MVLRRIPTVIELKNSRGTFCSEIVRSMSLISGAGQFRYLSFFPDVAIFYEELHWIAIRITSPQAGPRFKARLERTASGCKQLRNPGKLFAKLFWLPIVFSGD